MTTFQNKFTEGQFLSLYDETETDGKFHVCRYLYEDDSFVLFQAISTRGYNDGFYLIPIDYIYRVDVSDEYTNRIEKLFNLQKQQKLEFSSLTNESLLIQLLNYAKQHRLVTSVFLEDNDDITGLISDVNAEEDILCIEQLTEDGEKNGIAFVKIEKIEKVICNSGTERLIEMLMDKNTEEGFGA